MSQCPATVRLETSLLRADARREFEFWQGIIEPLLALPKAGILREIRAVATRIGRPAKTVYNKYVAAKKRGLLALVNRKLAGPAHWKLKGGGGALSAADVELVRQYALKNQRGTRAAMKALRRDWQTGKVTTETPVDPLTRMPRGWSPRNLSRHAPRKFQLKAARIGRSAAAAERPLVYTTRKGLWVGSHYMLDDMWHDFFVNTFAENQAGRPLELFSHDLYSARKVRWGVRVHTRKADGSYNNLAESMTRMILAATLYLDGYSQRGTKIVAEHGTAAVGERIERALADLTMRDGQPLVTVSRSGITGAKAHAGQYAGISRGNFRHKASLESSNNLTHNVFASLPGQTGKDVEHRPEQLHGQGPRFDRDGKLVREGGLLWHNQCLLAARRYLSPEKAAKLAFPLLELREFHEVAHELYRGMENDPDHELNDWVECGHVVQELLLGETWVEQTKFVKDEAHMAVLMDLIDRGAIQTRPRRMSRREVWDRGAGELIRLPGHGVVAILGDDLAVERRVRQNMIEFEDAEVGPGVHRFSAVCVTPFGERMRLTDGETYETFVNPFAPATLFARRADGSYLGECERITAPCRADVEAVERAMGRAARDETEMLIPLRLTMLGEAREKAAMHENNAEVIGGDAKRAAKHDAREAAATARFGAAVNAEREAADAAALHGECTEVEDWTEPAAGQEPVEPAEEW